MFISHDEVEVEMTVRTKSKYLPSQRMLLNSLAVGLVLSAYSSSSFLECKAVEADKGDLRCAEGVCLEQRQSLLHLLKEAEKLGIGTRAYSAQLESIEKQVQDGVPKETVSEQIEKLGFNIRQQMRDASNRRNSRSIIPKQVDSFSPRRVITPYLVQLENRLRSQAKLFPSAAPVEISCKLSREGHIGEAKAAEGEKASPRMLESSIAILRKIALPKPPFSIPYLVVAVSNKADAIVAYDKETDFGSYMQHVQDKIKANWHPPRQNSSKRVMLKFKIFRDGSSKFVESDSQATELAAMDALRRSSPFNPLPDGAPAHVDVQFSFDYNVRKNGKKI